MQSDLNKKTLVTSGLLFRGFNTTEIETILELAKTVKLEKEQFLFYENMMAADLYIIQEGVVRVLKSNFEITCLEDGDYVGEIALIDQRERTASIQAKTSVTLLSFSQKELQKFPDLFEKLTVNLSHVLAERLRESNTIIVDALKKEAVTLRNQTAMQSFFSMIIIFMSIYFIGYRFVTSYFQMKVEASALSSARLIIIVALLTLIVIKKSDNWLNYYGVTFRNWKKSITESICYTLPILLAIFMVKWIAIYQSSFGRVWAIKSQWLVMNYHTTFPNLLSILIGYILFAPIIEFVARGCLQGSLQQFFTGNYIRFRSILIASLLYSSLFFYFPPALSVIAFVFGLFWGWLYSRHKTIVGVSLSHILIGLSLYLTGFSLQII